MIEDSLIRDEVKQSDKSKSNLRELLLGVVSFESLRKTQDQSVMQSPKKRKGREYKDFVFRRRHDHFLRIKLLGATQDEVIGIAKELGFNIDIKGLKRRKRHSQKINTMEKVNNRTDSLKKILKRIIRYFQGK